MHGMLRRLRAGQSPGGQSHEGQSHEGQSHRGRPRPERLPGGRPGGGRPGTGTGTTIDRFRLNEVVSQIAFGGRRGRVYRRIVSLSGVRPGDSVLDVGSSSGYLARKLAAAAGPAGRVTGVDPSGAAIAHAQRRASRTMTFTVGTAQNLDLPDACFDVVTCTLALHHIPARKREAAIREMYRVTKPGGHLLLADFDPSRRPFPLHPGGRRMRHAAGTVGALEELAMAAGYQIESAGRLPLLRFTLATRPRDAAIRL
jgi:SAM-dependent methyltransferase